MPTNFAVNRSRLCAFIFDDGDRCRSPRRSDHPYCYFHARKDAQSRAAKQTADNIASEFSGPYIAFRDLSQALAHTISAVAYGHMKPKAASTIAYLGQSLVQSLARAESEHLRAIGAKHWGNEIVNSYNNCLDEKERQTLEEEPPSTPSGHLDPPSSLEEPQQAEPAPTPQEPQLVSSEEPASISAEEPEPGAATELKPISTLQEPAPVSTGERQPASPRNSNSLTSNQLCNRNLS
jgi:hypothetical protein